MNNKYLEIYYMHSIDQGEQLNKGRRKYSIPSSRLNLISKSTSSHLEGMTTMKNAASLPDSKERERIQDLQSQFNTLLTKYHEEYSQFLKDLSSVPAFQQQHPKGGNIMDKGQTYYVNKHGYARQYPEHHKDSTDSCPTQNLSGVTMKQLRKGTTLQASEPCGFEGVLIQNKETKEVSWVLPQGGKKTRVHKETCQRLPVQEVDESIYNAIPTIGTLGKDDMCTILPQKPDNLMKMNEQLLKLSRQIYDEIAMMETKDIKVLHKTRDMRGELFQQVQHLEKERNELEKQWSRYDTYSQEYEDNQLLLTSNYYQFFMWMVIIFGLGGLTLRHMTSR